MNSLKCNLGLFFPKRLVFDVVGGPGEGWSPESSEGGGGVSEAAQEALAEELRRSAAAQKKDQKREQKAKKRDNKLAGLITGFIRSGASHDHLLLLIARLLKRNTPIAVIVAILSLNYPEFKIILDELVAEEEIPREDEPFDARVNALVPVTTDLARALDDWADAIFTHASFQPMQTINALAHHEGVNSSCLQLTAFMLQEFLERSGQPQDMDALRPLADGLWRSILKKVHRRCAEMGLLQKPGGSEPREQGDEEKDV